MNKHWEAELAALKGNNAKLTAALLESTANVKQWKQQLAAYQEEAERLHKRVRRHRGHVRGHFKKFLYILQQKKKTHTHNWSLLSLVTLKDYIIIILIYYT